jgi:hypothetical protein
VTATVSLRKSTKSDSSAAASSGSSAPATNAAETSPAPTTKAAPTTNASPAAATPASRAASKPAPTGNASDGEIAAAKSSGKVWVNLDSGVYHKSGRWYGKTKNGKFMTESEAKAAGYKASQTD